MGEAKRRQQAQAASLDRVATTVELPPLSLRAEVRAESINPDERTAEVVFSTGAPVERYDWRTDSRYLETLSLEPGAVRLRRLNNSAPFLNTHSTYDLSAVLGVVVPSSAKVTGKQGVATIRFSRREDVEPVWQDVLDGIVRNVSVGYRVHKYEQTEATAGKPAIRHAIDWEPYEISAVPMGADDGAKVRAAQQTQTNPCLIERAGEEPTSMEETTAATTTPVTPDEPRQSSTHTDPGAPTGHGATPTEGRVAETDRQTGIVAERERNEGITRAVLSLQLPIQLAQDLITKGTPLLEAQNIIIAEKARRSGDDLNGNGLGNRRGPSGVIEPGLDANSHVRSGIENALLHRIKPDWFKLDELGKLYANRRMIGLAECWLQSCGLRTTTMGNLDIAGIALGLNQRAGLHTTSDFANILADVMGKTLRRAYDEAPQVFGPIVSRKELVDFKPVRRTQLSEAPALDLVNEHGEFTSGTMSDAKEQYQLATYGKTFGITRQALVNDDLDAFTNLAIQFGRSARQKESDLVWLQITSNPTMGDGVALFHATHANLAGSGAAIDITTIGAGWTAMGLQKGLAGVEYLNITPLYLIVPKGKETIAKQFVSVNMQAATASNINPFAGALTVIADPRLDAASATAWYLAASTSVVDIVELGFLAGQTGPMVESQIGFKVDGIEVKCRHDVAAKVIDFRGLYKNAGA